jgi:predicted outer membrane lipoprotein
MCRLPAACTFTVVVALALTGMELIWKDEDTSTIREPFSSIQPVIRFQLYGAVLLATTEK